MFSRVWTDLRFLAIVFLGEILFGDLEFFGLLEFYGDLDLSTVDLKVLTAFGDVAFLLLTETGDALPALAPDFWWRVMRRGGTSSLIVYAVVVADFY